MERIKMVLPKGRMMKNVIEILHEAGYDVNINDRDYRPSINTPEMEVKLMKPQNIPELVALGSHDIGFTGYDWIRETGSDVEEIMDLKFDTVRIVAAVPEDADIGELKKRKIIVASEYENISREFLDRKGYDYHFLRTYGATEVFPPEDADMIIDNTSTGKTLKDNKLKIVETILESSTRFVANKESMKDPRKREIVEKMKLLFNSINDARERVVLEMNVPGEIFDEIISTLPSMRSPTVSPLYGKTGYAVKVAVRRTQAQEIIPVLKAKGVKDILEYDVRKVIS